MEQEIVDNKSLFKLSDGQMQRLIQHYNDDSISNVAIRLTQVQVNTFFTNITYVISKSGDRVCNFVYCIKEDCYGEVYSSIHTIQNATYFLLSKSCQITLLMTKQTSLHKIQIPDRYLKKQIVIPSAYASKPLVTAFDNKLWINNPQNITQKFIWKSIHIL